MKQGKLTLRLEEELIHRAKRIARERDTSVSRMVAGFFESIEDPRVDARRHGEITRRLRGSVKPRDRAASEDEERDYRRHLKRKHE